jgi:hypothetical protein
MFNVIKYSFFARRRGLVVRVKTHVQEIVSSNPGPAVGTIYHASLIWIKSMKANIVWKSNLALLHVL